MKRFEFVYKHRDEFAIARLVSVLKVSRSGYYQWLSSRDRVSPRQRARQARDGVIKAAFDRSKQRNGATRLQRDLADEGMRCDVKTISASLKRQALIPKAARRFKATTDSRHAWPVAPNRLGQDFTASAPNQKWAGDITYLHTREGWLYLAVIIDLYSRAVVGWSMSTRMTAGLVCDALTMALWRRQRPKHVIVHSDRDSQYCSTAYRKLIDDHQLRQSMSRKGNCWDNACVESFFHSLKVEAIYGEPTMDRAQMKQAVFEYIEVDYNRTRRHSAIGYISPAQFEAMNVS